MAAMPPQPSFQSNYPRGQVAGMAYTRPPGVYFDSIGTAYEMLKSDVGVYAASTLIFFAVTGGLVASLDMTIIGAMPTAMGVPSRPTAGTLSGIFLIEMIVQFILNFLLLGLVGIGVRHAMGHYPSIPDLFLPFKRFGRTAKAVLVLLVPAAIWFLVSFSMGLGTPRTPAHVNFAVVLPLAGLGFVVWFLLYGPLYLGACAAAFSDLPVLEAYGQGFKRLGWQIPALSGLLFLSGLVASVGLIACCIGMVFTFPIYTNVMALHYTYYFPPAAPRPVTPTEGVAV